MHLPVRPDALLWGWLRLAALGWAVAPVLCAAPPSLAPCTPDEWTLHLWHLDEAAAPFADRAANGTDLLGLLNNAEAGMPSLPGLGSSVSFHHDAGGVRGTSSLRGGILLAAAALADGNADNAPPGFRCTGEDGAFTIEAVVRFDVLPAQAGTIALGLVSMDGEGANRVFNFRVETSGFLAFIPLGVSVAGGGALAAIPTTGAHAINTTDWFHVATTYNGSEGTPNNLGLYWTRLDVPRTEAHLIGRGTLLADLRNQVADFAIGNEARDQSRTIPGNAEAEPFPGRIDEVRISSVARHPTDYGFVPPEQRRRPGQFDDKPPSKRILELELAGVLVDGEPVALPSGGRTLTLPPGAHRLDIDFGIKPQDTREPVKLRCRLRGVDDRWIESGRGMVLACEVLDAGGQAVSTAQFPALGASWGWQTGLHDSTLTPRSEPFHVPAGGRSVRFQLRSGTDDTTGTLAIDGFDLALPSKAGGGASPWPGPPFGRRERTTDPARLPPGWVRSGSSPMIARAADSASGPVLALVDGDQSASGVWTSVVDLPALPPDGVTTLLQWNEAYNVIGGASHRATFLRVPPGEYAFEAIATGTGEQPTGAHLALPLVVRAPFWSRPWLRAAAAACVIGSLAIGVLAFYRQRGARRLEGLRLQNALALDRARIARDMHDDLGTRITLLTMDATLAQGDLDGSPEHARRHLGRIAGSARDLVAAMDDLVWAVDPANDTLDHLADHLARLAEDMFQGSPVRCRVEIPHVLPARTVTSDLRHHLSLAVKEALHNILQHAGPCEASLTLAINGDWIEVVAADSGRGFDHSVPSTGHGRGNLPHRMEALGGTCGLEGTPGRGTRVVLRCPLSPVSMGTKPP